MFIVFCTAFRIRHVLCRSVRSNDITLLYPFSALLPDRLVFQRQLQVYYSPCFGSDTILILNPLGVQSTQLGVLRPAFAVYIGKADCSGDCSGNFQRCQTPSELRPGFGRKVYFHLVRPVAAVPVYISKVHCSADFGNSELLLQ